MITQRLMRLALILFRFNVASTNPAKLTANYLPPRQATSPAAPTAEPKQTTTKSLIITGRKSLQVTFARQWQAVWSVGQWRNGSKATMRKMPWQQCWKGSAKQASSFLDSGAGGRPLDTWRENKFNVWREREQHGNPKFAT
jgi:hypothetical protein